MMLLSLLLATLATKVIAAMASNVTRVPVSRTHYNANGTKALIKVYHKYNITPHGRGSIHRDNAGKLMKRQADGSSTQITTEDEEQDSFYTLPVLIGTPAQKLVITPDSGSADFWVWSSQLPSDTVRYAKAHGAPLYNPAISSTYTPLNGSTWSIHYGDGSAASGTVGKDVLQVGDITIHNQAVEIANRMSSSLVTQPASQGILGLAFGDINTVQPVQQKTPLDNMIAQDDIPEDQELFTCYLGSYKDVNDPDHGQSFFTFGKIDQDVVQASGGQMKYTPVDDTDGFWTFNSEFMTINDTKVDLTGNTAIADTGTTLMIIQDDLVAKIYSTIPGAMFDDRQQGWVFPANTPASKMPTVGVAVGETQIIIEKEHLGIGNATNGMIYGGIQGRGSLNQNIFGDTFLKCVYAVFDAGKKQFGVVQRVDPTQNTAG